MGHHVEVRVWRKVRDALRDRDMSAHGIQCMLDSNGPGAGTAALHSSLTTARCLLSPSDIALEGERGGHADLFAKGSHKANRPRDHGADGEGVQCRGTQLRRIQLYSCFVLEWVPFSVARLPSRIRTADALHLRWHPGKRLGLSREPL